jgi:hypothetical protein
MKKVIFIFTLLIVAVLFSSCLLVGDLVETEKELGFDAVSMTNTYAGLPGAGVSQKVAEISRTYVSYYARIDGDIYEGWRGDVQLSRVQAGHWFGHFETLETWNNQTEAWETHDMPDGFICLEFFVALEELTLYIDMDNDGFRASAEMLMNSVAEATPDWNTFGVRL